jgi:hypothetical protein
VTTKPDNPPAASQDVAHLRPGQEQQAPRSEFQRAEAETVMFASARALPPPDFPTQSDIRAASYRYQIHPRRVWVTWGAVGLILLLQVLLTLRMNNTAFEDEGLYLYVGHLEIVHFLHGASLQGDYPSYFSGAPVLYPVLGATADKIGGLAAARAVSLLELLLSTVLVYLTSKRLFDEWAGLCAALVFAVAEPTLFLGNLATYDASALCLLGIAAWIVVRTAEFRWPVYLLAAPVLVLATATKYATLLYIPSVVALVGLTAARKYGWRMVALRLGVMVALLMVLYAALVQAAGPDYMAGFKFTTLDRFEGNTPTSTLLRLCLEWVGVPFALAVYGAVLYAWESGPDMTGSRRFRAVFGAIMCLTLLLAPVEQIRIHTATSLHKHVGFGLLIAAPIVGVGLAKVVREHFRRLQVGIAIWGLALALGMTTANDEFNLWPNSATYVTDMSHYLKPGAHYLVEVDEVPIYYLRGRPDAQPTQFTSTFAIDYFDPKTNRLLTGNDAYAAAIRDSYFQFVGFDMSTTPDVDAVIAKALAQNPNYRLASVITADNNGDREYLWVKTG